MTSERGLAERVLSVLPRDHVCDAVECSLSLIESQIALLERASSGRRLADLSLVLKRLDEFEASLAPLQSGLRARLLEGRLAELKLEAHLAAELGGAPVLTLSAELYAPAASVAGAARELGWSWLVLDALEPELGPSVLVKEIAERRIEELGIDVPVIERPLFARAAAADGVLYLAPRLVLPEREARRVVHHELFAHLIPRRQASHMGAPFRIGTRDSARAEEGRAIVLEHQADLLSVGRRRELGLRHWAALAVAEGRTLDEIREEVEPFGYSKEQIAFAVERSRRGGGLCRERIYLEGYVELTVASTEVPEVGALLGLGRLSVRAALEISSTLIDAPYQ